jgi:hypothetical protein
MSTALVTGPTSGIGRAFARQLASDGYDMVLVARDADRLQELADELAASGARAEVLVADLSDRSQLSSVEERLRDPSRPVDLLVNNAGFGMGQRFISGDVEREQRAIDVMVTAVMRLSHAALPGMVARGRGGAVNVSSIAGFLPYGTYSAAKSWVTVFTQALANELDGTGVRAVAVCPGFVRTEFHDRAGIDLDRSDDRWWLDADVVVRQALHDLRRGKVISVAGRQYRAIATGSRLLPRDLLRRTERLRRSRLADRL